VFGDEVGEEVVEVLGIGHRLSEDIGAEAVFEGVFGDSGLSFGSGGSGRRLRVPPIGVDLCLRSHKSSSWFENSGRDQIIGGEEKGNKLDMLLGYKKIKIFQTPVNGFCGME
jgi:hypothetical protein